MKSLTVIVLAALTASTGFCQMWEVGRMEIPDLDNGRHLRAYGDYCFVCKYPVQMIVADVLDPSIPTMVSSLFFPFPCYFTVAENTLYCSGGGSSYSVHMVDLQNLPLVTYLGETTARQNAVDLEARGDYLYVTDYNGGVVVFNIEDRLNPIQVARVSMNGGAYSIKLSENYMYLGIHHQGLEIWDISIPENPAYVSFLPIPSSQYPWLTKDEEYVYFATYRYGFAVVDVSNPYMPNLVYFRNPISLDRYIEYANERVFLGNWSEGAKMFDVTDITEPEWLSTFPPLFSGTKDVTVAGHHLFVGDLSHLRVMRYTDEGDGYYDWVRTRFYWHDDVRVLGQWWPSVANEFTDPIPIGFTFPFYDNTYDTLYVCSNGFIAFNNYSPSYWDTPIPCDTQPNNIIAPFWDRFDPTGKPRHIFTKLYHNPTRFVVEFYEMPRVGTAEYETFQVILFPDGTISFQYPEVMNPFSATVGIENETGTRGIMIVHNYSRNVPDSVGIAFIRRDARGGGLPVEKIITLQKKSVGFKFSTSPNPFNSETVIRFNLSDAAEVSVKAYNVQGGEVGSLFEGRLHSGVHTVNWNPQGLTSGVYFIKAQSGGNVKTARVLYMK